MKSHVFGRSVQAATLACALASASSVAAQPQISFEEEGVVLDLGDAEVTIGGRVHLDSLVAEQSEGGDQVAFRRARIEVSAKLPGDFRFRGDYDFASGREGVRNLYLDYRGIEGVSVRAGQMVVPFNFEELMQSNDLLFMERSLAGSLAPGFNAGVAVSAAPGNWSLQGGVFFDPIDGTDPSGRGTSLAARAVYRPIQSRDHVLHFGGAIERRELSEGARPRFRSRQEQSLGRRRLSTGRIDGAEATTGFALEGLYQRGPFLVQAQAMRRDIDLAGSNASFKGGHIQSSYLFGDVRRRYSRRSGVLGAVEPQSGSNAFEFAARASFLDLEDQGINGGEEFNLSGALNWYANRNLRLSLMMIHSRFRPDEDGVDDNAVTGQGRVQVRF